MRRSAHLARTAGTGRPIVALAAVLVAVLGLGIWGLGLFDRLGSGGYVDPSSESGRALAHAVTVTGAPDIVALYSAPSEGDLAAIAGPVIATLDAFERAHPEAQVQSHWTSPPAIASRLVSPDGRTGLATISFPDRPADSLAAAQDLFAELEAPQVDTRLAGDITLDVAFSVQLQSDLIRAEMIAVPITAILLVIVFGGLVAALIPVLTGVLTVLLSIALLRALTIAVDVNAFAINLAALLGLGLSIDYGLFLVSRFREELLRGRRRTDGRDTVVTAAVRRTVRTAGRTIAFSATLLVAAFVGLLVFPQPVIRSLGLGAICSTIAAAALSLTMVPLVLLVLGRRVDALTWSRDAARRADERAGRFWSGVVGRAIRRPKPIATAIGVLLVVLSLPSVVMTLGDISAESLPASSSTREAFERLDSDFGAAIDTVPVVLLDDTGSLDGPAINGTLTAARAISGVADVEPERIDSTTVIATVVQEPTADRQQVVRDLRSIDPPENSELLVGGRTAIAMDNNAAIARTLPWMAGIMIVATLVLLLVAFGSVLLAVKAIAMAALSLGVTFGALTWIFQEGHGAGLLGVTPQPLEATFVVVIVAIVFGLSTDYEVFLVSRMVEARAGGAETSEAIVAGARHTGRIITAAALILIVVTGAFATSSLSSMRMVGVGMIIALVVDATIIRMLLVPTLVKVMGEANWWAPRPIAAAHRRWGIGG